MIKVERSATPPRSLVQSTAKDRYRAPDVVERLVADFRGKCYICESYPVDDPEVEHLLPHKGFRYPERAFAWTNLFYSCRHCNSVKSNPKYDEGIIDCCVRDPEELLGQDLVEDSVHVEVLQPDDPQARLTAELIEEVFTSDKPALRSKAAEARLSKLQRRMNALYSKLQEYSSSDEGSFARASIMAMLKRESAYSGFTRRYMRQHLAEYPEFKECLL